MDEAFFDVAEGIRKVVIQLTVSPAIPSEMQQEMNAPAVQRGGKVFPSLPQLAIEKLALLRTLMGHTFYVTSVALNAGGQTLVSGSSDQTIKVWGT